MIIPLQVVVTSCYVTRCSNLLLSSLLQISLFLIFIRFHCSCWILYSLQVRTSSPEHDRLYFSDFDLSPVSSQRCCIDVWEYLPFLSHVDVWMCVFMILEVISFSMLLICNFFDSSSFVVLDWQHAYPSGRKPCVE